MNVTRREAVIRMALWMGATALGPRLRAGDFAQHAGPPPDYSADDLALLDEIGDTIIPATDTPGAKAVGIGAFIAMMVTDCYWPAEQQVFKDGLARLRADYRARHGEDFIGSPAARRTEFLDELDREQRAHDEKNRPPAKSRRPDENDDDFLDEAGRPPPHYFRIMKELTLLGYFTSEVAQTRIFDYLEVPGRFDGNVPYTPRQTAAKASA